MPYRPQRMEPRRRGAPWWVVAAAVIAALCSLALIANGSAGWASMIIPTGCVAAWALTWLPYHPPSRGRARRAARA